MAGCRREASARVVAAGAVALFLGGCAGYSAPTLTITDAKATNETDAGLALAFTLVARNDNEVALPLRAAEYELELGPESGAAGGGPLKEVFRGTRSPEASLRRQGEQTVMLPAVISLRDENGQPVDRPVGLHRFRLDTHLTYVTPGAFAEMLFDTGVRRPVASVTQTGVLDFGAGPGSGVRLVNDEGQ